MQKHCNAFDSWGHELDYDLHVLQLEVKPNRWRKQLFLQVHTTWSTNSDDRWTRQLCFAHSGDRDAAGEVQELRAGQVNKQGGSLDDGGRQRERANREIAATTPRSKAWDREAAAVQSLILYQTCMLVLDATCG